MALNFIYTSLGGFKWVGFTEKEPHLIPKDLIYPPSYTSKTEKRLRIYAYTRREKTTILSSIMPTGKDSVGRPGNYLAHHLVMESEDFERCKAGPAWLLKRRSFLENWEQKETQRYEKRPIPINDYLKIKSPPTWKRYFPENWMEKLNTLLGSVGNINQRCVVVFDGKKHPEETVLDLFYEALSWLEPEQRWEVTFGTNASSKVHKSLGWKWLGVDCSDSDSLKTFEVNAIIIVLPVI